MRWALFVLLFTATLSGCASSDPVELPDEVEEVVQPWINPIQLEHDHDDPLLHDIANNITQVGHHPLGDDGPPGGISEIDVAGGYAFIGIMGFGFQVVDLSNITAPELAASVELTSTDQQSPLGVYLADIKTDATGDWVFVATELSTNPGVHIYDARDKSDIKLAGFWPEPGLLAGCHMIEYAQINENEYLFCAPLDNAVYVGQILPPTGPVREIVQVARWMPTTPKFVQQQGNAVQGYIDDGDYAGAALHFVSGHQDMTFQEDPLTGTPTLTVSFWNLGVRFVDVSIPEVPLEIGSWQGENADYWSGVLHTSMMFADGERRIAVTIPEGGSPSTMYVLDATDLNNPVILSEWTGRDDFKGEEGKFIMHNFQVIDGKVYMAHYHGGIWVLDISNETLQKDPYALGTYMPWDRDTGRGCCGGILAWDVVYYQGYILTANGGGFFALHLKDDLVGVDAPSSFA